MAMTADVSLSTCCSQLQHQLISLNAPNTFNEMRNYGILNALESPRNKAGIDQGLMSQLEAQYGMGKIDDDGEGVNCKFKLWVEKPECDTASDGVGTLCSNSTTNAPTNDKVQVDVKITRSKYKTGKIEPSDIKCLCQGTIAQNLTNEITKAAKNILKSVNSDLGDLIGASMGDYIDGTASLVTPKILNLFASSNNFGWQVQPAGWTPMLLEYAQMQVSGGAIAVGGDAVFAYQTSLNLAPSLAGGYNLPNGVETWFDPYIQANFVDATFTNPLFTWAPGALWLMRYLDNVNVEENHVMDPTVGRTVVNIFGQNFDLLIKRDAACDKLIWVLNYQYDLYQLPQEAWGNCLATNQCQAYDIGCDILDCTNLYGAAPTP